MKIHPVAVFLRLGILVGLLTSTQFGVAADKVAAWGENDYNQCLLPNGLNNVKAIAAGTQHGLALKTDGTVVGWGYNAQKQASPPPGLSGVIAIAAGGGHSLALRADGSLVTWGASGNGLTNFPSGLNGSVRAIAAGGSHSLALKTDGTVVAWGWNYYGQTIIPSGLSNVIAIAASSYHNLALKSDGTVAAWGYNAAGQTNVPTGLSNVTAIAAGAHHNLALRADGTVFAWGDNYGGRTNVPVGLSNVIAIAAGFYQNLALKSDGTIVSWGERTNVPPGISGATAIAMGESHALAIVPTGPPEILTQPADLGAPFQSNVVLSVVASGFEPLSYRWHLNGYPLADSVRIAGTTTAALTIANAQFSDIGHYSVIVSNGLGVVQSTGAVLNVISPPIITLQPVGRTVLAGTNITLTAAAMGTPPLSYRWLFNGTPIAGAIGTSLSLSNVQSSHNGSYSLMVSNVYGVTESSNALVTVMESAPYMLKQPTNATAILGGVATFAGEARGSAPLSYQWRFNGADLPGATQPVLPLASVGYDAAGFYTVIVSNHLGVVVSDKVELSVRQIAVWGSAFFTPTNIAASITNLVAISAGSGFLLGLKADGTVSVFSGRAGFSTAPTNVPSGLNGVAAIAAGGSHCLALKSNGTVAAWGDAFRDPFPRPPLPPSPGGFATNVPAGLSNVIAIAAGDKHNLALTAEGKVVSWGVYWPDSVFTPANYVMATNVPANLSNVIAIAAGGNQSLALKSDGRVVAWGNATNVPATLSNVIAVACAEGLGLALQANGRVVAWAAVRATSPYPGPWPRIGLATNVPANLTNAVAIATAGQGSTALALRANGTVAQWGSLLNTITPPAGLSNVFAITVNSSLLAALVADGAPRLTIQPASQTVAKGATVRLTARAAGSPPLNYQWQLDGLNLATATQPDLIITNVGGSDTGDYRVIVTNPLGSIASKSATLTIPYSTNLPVALNATNLVWTNSSTAPWFAQIRETHDGNVAAQSGRVGNNQQSLLQTTVVGPGTLRFWWKISSEQGYDRLWFSLDTQNWAAWISGETDWQQLAFPIPAGSHTLNWAYTKDATVTVGQDAGWLDEVTFTPATALNLAAPQLLLDGTFTFWSRDPNGRELLPFNLPAIEVQASTNLRDWVALPGVCTLTNGALLIRDQTSTNFPMRFYRVIER